MATKYECDRCKTIQDRPLHSLSPRSADFDDDFHDWRLRDLLSRYELCEGCMILIAEILNNRKAIVTVPSGQNL
jgi:hypothetical protein